MIHVLIIDDLKSAADLIADILRSDNEIIVSGIATDKDEALRQVVSLQPQLIVLDSYVGKFNGMQLAREIMRLRPTPILMTVSAESDLTEDGKDFFSCGVIELIDKNELYRWRTRPDVAQRFIKKVKMLSRIGDAHWVKAKRALCSDAVKESFPNIEGERKVVAIVSSTGGPNTLVQVLSRLQPDFPAPVLLVQHMSKGFIQGFAEWLDEWIALKVSVAEDKGELLPGRLLLAPDDRHLTVNSHRQVKLVDDPPVRGHRPSGDYLLRSVGKHFRSGALGVVLTGMGKDGAEGMRRLKALGGKTIAQDEASSIIFGMPKAAIDLGVVDRVLSIDGIAEAMIEFAGSAPLKT